MATLTITIPDSIDDVPAALASLRAQLAAVSAQRDALCAAIVAVQRVCKHPHMTYSRDYDGGTSSNCPTCGYSN